MRFNQLHGECGSRIQMPKWCSTCDRKVEAGELVKGYEVSKGEYVVLTDEDFESLPLKSVKTVEIVQFVDAGDIDPRVYEKAYFLGPEEAGGKSYSLLMETLEASGLSAVAKLCYRDREHLALIRPFGGVLALHTLHYSDELRDPGELGVVRHEVSGQELELAKMLVQALQGELDLAAYRDEYREALTEMVKAKLAGETVTAPAAAKPTKSGDLSAALQASVEAILAAKDAKNGVAAKRRGK